MLHCYIVTCYLLHCYIVTLLLVTLLHCYLLHCYLFCCYNITCHIPFWSGDHRSADIDTKNKSLVCSEPKLQFHSLKLSLASYSPSTIFLTFRSIWGSWKWSQMIYHGPKHWVWHQKQVCSMFRTKVTISLLEVVLGLLQLLHPVLDLQVYLRLMNKVPNDFPWPKTLGLTPKTSL